ncbi:hypothetical protein [Roseovarius sp. M141]|uniref:hypothetical protein n=1 Tax=Roseovarius sp. M141 TaxID=2583806 RepID=UPI0020CEDF1A|nr:hypothetical protein [Roseovarius sp. M141]MCQ0090827.1 hypothetical protein [Roseovarius sp. M141]
MGQRIRIPGLLDLLIIDQPGEILDAAADPVLDRGATRLGPILNRIIQNIRLRSLRTDKAALPSALPREDATRIAMQDALAQRLDPADTPWDGDSLQAIADWLRGAKAPIGPLCQQAVGRLFVPDFRATPRTWRAAHVINRSLALTNPALRLLWALTGEVTRAKRTLSEAMHGDPAAVHATGVAVHTFQRAVERLDGALAAAPTRRALSTKGALGCAAAAPDTVLRHASAHADIAAGTVAPGTLVFMRLDGAAQRSADPRVAFMSDSWSACPAHRVVPAMLAEIWFRATGERTLPAQVT